MSHEQVRNQVIDPFITRIFPDQGLLEQTREAKHRKRGCHGLRAEW